MAVDIVSSVVGKLAEYAIDPLLRQFKHMICYNSKIQTLRDKKRALETEESEVRELVLQAKNNTQDIKPVVEDWLQNVGKIKKEADEIFEGATNSEMQCLFLRCPNLKTRYSLGRKATEKTAEVANLLDEGKLFQNVAEPKQPVQIPYRNPGDFGAFETRISIKKEIMDALKDKDVSIIGICGMGGVGKTTMAKEIANEAKIDKLFDEFAWAEVSHDPDVTKIQDQLASKLSLNIKDCTDKDERAERLRKRLGGDRSKSILVILDDVWEDTVLETIGVLSARDDKGLKILLTSREKDVCKRMKAQRIFDVNILNEKESWELFKEKAEISDDATDVIKDTAEKIAKECDGLPLALVIVGRALSKKPEYAWKDALVELRSSAATNITGVQKLVHSRIKLSYDYLESEEAKSLLLLCSLYAEDANIPIEDLVRYAWGLELFRGTMTLIATRDRVKTIVDHLKSCYLLLSAEDTDSVRLHDVVRDVCLQIASKDKHAYMSEHIGLKEWPKLGNDESYSAISLTSNELNQLPSGLEYPNLKFLKVDCHEQSVNISKEFFADTKELRVLDFTSTRIQIPSSIQMLTNLRTLCLDHCTLNIEISTIGNLKKLEVLSFYGSALDHFPEDIAELSNLRILDLRFKHSSSKCPLLHGILLQLKKLEELYLGVVEIRDDELEQRGHIIKEISSLTGLNTFQISTHDPQFLLQILRELCIEKLERFHIELTDLGDARRNIGEHCYFRRRLHIRDITYASMLSEPEINSLMWRTDHLSIEMHLNNLDDLSQHVTERKKDGFEHLNENHPTGAFDGLQEVNLNGIPKMKHLFRGLIKPSSLHNLTFLTIKGCPSLKSLFSESVALGMVNLQSLHISDCKMLEEIVSMDMEQNEITQMLQFPKLQKITLEHLRNFKSFRCGSNKTVGVLNPLFKQVTLPNLELLDICGLGRTVTILDELRQIGSHKLIALKMRNLDDVSILFDFEYTKDDAEIRMLGQLKSLDVACLPKLVHITRMFPKGICIFKNLTRLKVKGCDNLRYLFSPSMANSLVALEGLRVQNCKAIEEIIGTQEEDNTSNIKIVEEGTTSRIVFPKLRRLNLLHLDRFRLLSSQNHELLLPSLEYLRIEHCLSLKSLFSELSCTVNLQDLTIRNRSMHNPLFKQVTLPNLESLNICGLGCTVTILDGLRQIGSHKLIALKMRNLDDVSILFDFEYTKDDAEIRMLGQLKSLDVACLPKLVHITRMFPKGICIFKNLTQLTVEGCDNLRYLFSPSMANSLVALEGLLVRNCKAIEEIIGTQEEDNTSNIEIVEEGTSSRIVFPKLRYLYLSGLDRFRLLSSQNYALVFPSLEYLIIENCPMMFPKGICIFKNLTHLKVEGCDNLRYLFSPSMANSLVALEHLIVQNCKAIEEVIGTQEEDNTSNIEIVEEGTTSKVVFPKLRSLRLLHLDRFRMLSSRNYELVLPSLEYLCIENCPMMTKLCPRRLLSAPKLDKVWINQEPSIDISNFLDFEDVREP